MFLADFSEIWVNVAEAFEYGLSWLWTNGGAILKYVFYAVGSGGLTTGVIVLLKTIVPLLKNSNKPVLKELGGVGENIQTLAEEIKANNEEIDQMKADNKTLKEYIQAASEANSKAIILSEEMRNKFGLIADNLKTSDNETISGMGEDVEQAIDDGEIDEMEAVEVAENIEEVEEVLGKSLDEITFGEEGD